jgi:hypothetical protein
MDACQPLDTVSARGRVRRGSDASRAALAGAHRMMTSIAVLAERAFVRPDGKLDVVGVYNCRFAPGLPAKLDVTLALRFELEPLDYGVHQRIAVHVIDEDGAEMVNLTASPVSFESPGTPGLPMAYDLVVPMTVGIPRDGTWTFDVRVNDRSLARVPLRVERRSEPGSSR